MVSFVPDWGEQITLPFSQNNPRLQIFNHPRPTPLLTASDFHQTKSQHIIRKSYNTLAIPVILLSGFLREPLFHCVHAEANRSCNLLYRQTLLIEVLRRHLSLFFPTSA